MQEQIDALRASGERNHDDIIQLQEETTLDRKMIAELQAEGLIDREHITQLELALTTSRKIGAAIGILMATQRCTEDQGFDILCWVSQKSNRKLRDVAGEVVSTGALPNW